MAERESPVDARRPIARQHPASVRTMRVKCYNAANRRAQRRSGGCARPYGDQGLEGHCHTALLCLS